MMFRRLRIVLTAALLLTAPAASASPLVADLSDHLIKITTGFTGTDVLLFGATDGPGQVIVVVRGPDHQIIVRRKERAAGIWVNGANRYFESAPRFMRCPAARRSKSCCRSTCAADTGSALPP